MPPTSNEMEWGKEEGTSKVTSLGKILSGSPNLGHH